MRRTLLFIMAWLPLMGSDFDGNCLPRTIGYLEFEAALLIWKVSTPGFFIGTLENKELVLPTKYQAGARLGFRYYSRDQCRYLAFTWHHFDRLNEDRAFTPSSGAIFTPNGLTDVISFREAGIKFEYNSLELLAGQRVICLPVLTLDLFAGLAGARIMQRHRILYNSESDGEAPMRSRAVFEGLGLEGGAAAEYCLPCGFSLVGRVGVAYMLGERRRDPEPLPNGNRIEFQDITEWIPAFYARGAFRYSYQAVPFCLFLECGYAVRHYANAFLRNTFPPQSDNSFAKDFTLGGPYFSVRIQF